MNDYSFVRRGRLVTVYAYGLSESDACAGSFDELDFHTELIREYLGVQGSSHYTFRWFSDDAWEALSPCSAASTFARQPLCLFLDREPRAGGCGAIVPRDPPKEHDCDVGLGNAPRLG